MAKTLLNVRAGEHSYPVTIGSGLNAELQQTLRRYPNHRIAVITDTTVKGFVGDGLVAWIKEAGWACEPLYFPAGEAWKTGPTLLSLCTQILERKFERSRTLIIALGGGVVGDIAGLVAGLIFRGVPFIQMPTTTLAMVDSSVGGKVAIDVPPFGKNQVGLFNQPTAVIAELQLLETLPLEHSRGGLIEAAKIFLARDAAALKLCEKLDADAPLRDTELLQEIILRSVRNKAEVVERDPHEENERKILNLGHTVGHAIESLSNFDLHHGICVGYGILAEAKAAELLGVLSPRDYTRVADILAHFGVFGNEYPRFPVDKIIAATRSDKKTIGGKAHCVLLNGIGSVDTTGRKFAHPVDDAILEKALRSLA